MKTNDVAAIRKVLEENMAHVIMFDHNGGTRVKVNFNNKIFPLRCKLYRDYEKKNDGVYWLLQCASVIKAEYTVNDMMDDRLFENAMTINDGEVYFILNVSTPKAPELVKVKAVVKGDYSDACVFEEID